MATLKKFQRQDLESVEIFLAEPNEYVREGLRAGLRSEGLRRTRTFTRLADLVEAIKETPPDLIVAASNLDSALFDSIRDIRHSRLGRNPFVMISVMADQGNDAAIKNAIFAGADDVLIKPVAPGKMLERVAHVTLNRSPFVVSGDYLGPERRGQSDLPANLRRIEVLNTFRAKLEGNRMTLDELTRAVDLSMNEVMSARLDSHGLKLGWVCGAILKAYEEKRIDAELEERLLMLVGVLEDAARTANVLGEPELADICFQFARQVEEMAEDYTSPTSLGLGTLKKLTKAFELAKTAKASAAAPRPAQMPANAV